MPKCFACSNDAEYILPCYHKICNICLNDIVDDGICLCYPNDDCDKQCLTSFTKEDVLPLVAPDDNNTLHIEKCSKHNKEYTYVCECGIMHCNKCRPCHKLYTIKKWKKHTLSQMENIRSELNNKIIGLNCIIEMITTYNNNNNDKLSIIKQIEDIIDTYLVDVSHINNFISVIHDDQIYHNAKRKKQLLDNIVLIQDFNIIKSLNTDRKIIDFIDRIMVYETKNNIANYTLCFASRYGYLAVVKYLVKSVANIHYNNNQALCLASEYGQSDIVECLISHGANVHDNVDQPLRIASKNGHLRIVECLIKCGANIHVYNDIALRDASSNNHLAVVECLIKHGADINTINTQALRNASYNGDLAIVECLIKHGADIHADNDSSLEWACRKGNLSIIKCLINNSSTINDNAITWASAHPNIVHILRNHSVGKVI